MTTRAIGHHPQPRVLLVDDDPVFLALAKDDLSDDYDPVTVQSGDEAIAALEKNAFDAVLLDLEFGDDRHAGLQILERLRAIAPDIPVIILTASEQLDDARRAGKAGAADFLVKAEDPGALPMAVARAIERATDNRALTALREQVRREEPPLIAESRAMRTLLLRVSKVAATHTPILLLGESGSGKDRLAVEIHRQSARRKGPFIPINCATLTGDTAKDVLFGHVPGAFTGADGRRAGAFERAKAGTLFLDEIGYLPLAEQARLLRVLENGTYEMEGSDQIQFADVRLISATSRDLIEAIRTGEFLNELYFRVNVVEETLPPLRERKEDILPIAAMFARRASREYGGLFRAFADDAAELLMSHRWGRNNIRELRNAVARAVVLSEDETLCAHHFTLSALDDDTSTVAADVSGTLPWLEYRDKAQTRSVREYWEPLLREVGGNVAEAARRAGIARQTATRLLEKHGVI